MVLLGDDPLSFFCLPSPDLTLVGGDVVLPRSEGGLSEEALLNLLLLRSLELSLEGDLLFLLRECSLELLFPFFFESPRIRGDGDRFELSLLALLPLLLPRCGIRL